jgi:iron complex outermembrane receptor protein
MSLKSKIRVHASAGVIGLFLASYPCAVFAQAEGDDSNGIGPIIVTAQKREENLQSVPISITALGQQALEQKGLNSIQDLANVPPPGLAVQSFGGANNAIIIDMRGVINFDPTQGTSELGVAVYQDDVYLGRAQGLGADLADPERIEILRGPQGTLFGRNAEGGAVRVVTSKPTGEFGGRVKVGFGDYGQERYEAHINLPEVAGFAVKFDYLKTSLNGYTKNGTSRIAGLVSQNDFAANESEGYRASVRWKPVDGLTVDYSFDHAKTDSTADMYVGVLPNPLPAGYVVGRPFLLDRSVPTQSLSSRTTHVAPQFAEPLGVKTSGHTLTAEYELSDALTLKSISAWRKVRAEGSQNLGWSFSLVPFATPILASTLVPDPRFGTLGTVSPSTPIYAVNTPVSYSNIRQHQFSQEVQLLGSTDELEWVLGGYYFTETVSDKRQSFLGGVFLDDASDGSYSNWVGTNPFTLSAAGPNVHEAHSRSFAAFAQITWSPAFADGRLHITPGLRYTNDRKTARRTIQNGAAVNITRDFKEGRVDPAFTIAYDVTSAINAYARYAQAYRAGGTSIRDPLFRSYGAEVNKAYELGVKSAFLDNRVILNVAAFYNDVRNRILTVQLDPVNPSITANINAPGRSPVKGVEVELTVSPARGLSLGATYAHMTGKLPKTLATIDTVANFYIQNLPKNSGTFSIDYRTPDLGIGKLAFHGDYTWADEYASTVRVAKNTDAFRLKRDVANVRVSLEDIPAGPVNLTIAGYVKNLFDTTYPVFATPGSSAILSAPRTYGVEAIARF